MFEILGETYENARRVISDLDDITDIRELGAANNMGLYVDYDESLGVFLQPGGRPEWNFAETLLRIGDTLEEILREWA